MRVSAAFTAALFVLATLFAAAPPLAAADLEVGDLRIAKPWARATVGTSRPAAAYMVIENKGGAADRLVGVSSAKAGMTETHKTEMTDGVMKMKPAGELEIPAGGQVELNPGGLHIMLMKLKEPLVEGESVTIDLVFERAGPVAVIVPIMSIGASGHEHEHEHE